jgi:hypothetical protein
MIDFENPFPLGVPLTDVDKPWNRNAAFGVIPAVGLDLAHYEELIYAYARTVDWAQGATVPNTYFLAIAGYHGRPFLACRSHSVS